MVTKNTLFVITAPSGSGKTTVMRSIMDNELVSFTTRAMRTDEINGVDYIFITREEFQSLLDGNGLMEYTEYFGSNFYGLTQQEFDSKIAIDDCFFIADYIGLKQMKEKYDNVVSIFIHCEKEDCEKNMRLRGDSEESIAKRLITYETEMSNAYKYDHIVVNNFGELDDTIEKVRDIIGGFQ